MRPSLAALDPAPACGLSDPLGEGEAAEPSRDPKTGEAMDDYVVIPAPATAALLRPRAEGGGQVPTECLGCDDGGDHAVR
jgi:hypothetical protein